MFTEGVSGIVTGDAVKEQEWLSSLEMMAIVSMSMKITWPLLALLGRRHPQMNSLCVHFYTAQFNSHTIDDDVMREDAFDALQNIHYKGRFA